MNPTLHKQLKALARMDEAVIATLKRLYPEGKQVRFWIMHGQESPSQGTVIGHQGGEFGEVIVRLASRTQQVRRVAADQIL